MGDKRHYFEFFGGVPERSKGADCKSGGSAFEGSNPSPTTVNLRSFGTMSGSSSVGRASAFQAECREFEPRLPLHFFLSGCGLLRSLSHAGVAQ